MPDNQYLAINADLEVFSAILTPPASPGIDSSITDVAQTTNVD
ncbi:hypothetical protein MNBD_GAMMA19-1621 [hydrothermal vent metagenome]|uniref:Uncharacterized protein n=1 Tax=hydrothermal vent metagenome TaxID=652676 RepID=A0A3B1B1V6_9ZZZZ